MKARATGRQGAVGVIVAAVILGLLIYAGPAGATTNPRAVADVKCQTVAGKRAAVATFTFSGFSPANHLTATQRVFVNGVQKAGTTFRFDGPGATTRVGAFLPKTGAVSVRVTTVVVGGAGRVKAEASDTIRCTTPAPPPPPPAHYAPRAHAEGPCGDPMYRFVFDNRRSNGTVTFRVRYLDFSAGWTTVEELVGRGSLERTGYRHVRGSSLMTIRARGETLFSRVSAPGGNYPACPR